MFVNYIIAQIIAAVQVLFSQSFGHLQILSIDPQLPAVVSDTMAANLVASGLIKAAVAQMQQDGLKMILAPDGTSAILATQVVDQTIM